MKGNEDLQTKDKYGVYVYERTDLTYFCLLGIQDTLRQNVKQAVEKCRKAGIKVRMVTGDNKITARAIAQECGILNFPDQLVMEGVEFMQKIGGVICKKCRNTQVCHCPHDKKKAEKMNLTEKDIRVDVIDKIDEFKNIIDKLAVIARCRPEDKYALVTGLTETGIHLQFDKLIHRLRPCGCCYRRRD